MARFQRIDWFNSMVEKKNTSWTAWRFFLLPWIYQERS